MKKNTRIILICAICLLSAGLMLISIGYFAGATFENAIKGQLWNYSIHYDNSYENDHNENNSYQISAGDIQSLNVDWFSGKIKIIPYDGDKIILTEKSEDDITADNCLRYKVKDGRLIINYLRGSISISFSNEDSISKDLTVKLPKELALNMEKLTLDSISADYDINDLKVKSLNYDTTSGTLNGTDISAKRLSINSISGDANLKFRRCPNDISFDSTSGDCTLVLPNKSNFNASIDSVSGELRTDFNCTIDDYDYIVGSGDNDFSFDTISGDVKISKLFN